jgi:hypothetical protein
MASERSRYISINLLPHHKEKLDTLVAHSGIRRNTLFRKLILAMEPEDVDNLLSR